nr:hypothetical protein [Nocardia cyriacigeorgica]
MPCTERILRAGIPRVVIAWREPATFVTHWLGVGRLSRAWAAAAGAAATVSESVSGASAFVDRAECVIGLSRSR